jgi:ribosomal peptide maturation radical SAM protein 1
MKRVALISMPFAAVDYPSLALGLFKSRLDAEGISNRTFYLNIDFARMVGFGPYTELVTRPPAYFAAEQIFASAAFGAALPGDAEYYAKAGLGADQCRQLQAVKSRVEVFLSEAMAQVPWHDFDIVGFTSLFEQNLASLALARRIKAAHPDKIVVVGGPNFEGIMGRTFHRLLPFIDYVCSGEADDTFPELIKRLSFGHPLGDLPGIVYRDNGMTRATPPAPMVTRMDALPLPDFSDYFAQIQAIDLPAGADPCVLIETSRGCWWGEKNHCTFCGLNAQTMTYRAKTATRAVDEIARMRERYDIRFVRVVDNILSTSFFDDFLPMLADRQLGVTIFFEVKANLRKQQIRILRDAGVTIVQAGIESLATPVLKLMRKGSNALMNVQTLKWCKEFGVSCDWNLIYGFPGEGPEDFAQQVAFARVMSHLDPPTGCGPIRLDRFSPNYDHAAELGFKNVRAMDWYRFVYPFSPRELNRVAYYFDFDYVKSIDDGGHLPDLHAAVSHWKRRTDRLYAVQDGNDAIICDSRLGAVRSHVRLNGLERLVFEAADAITTPNRLLQVAQQYGSVEEDQIADILELLVDHRFVAEEQGRYLALPVLTYQPELSLAPSACIPAHGAFLVSAGA